jgi:hypothetical protein
MADRLVRLKVSLFVLDAAPYAFDEDVVAPGTFAVHRHTDLSAQHGVCECARP